VKSTTDRDFTTDRGSDRIKYKTDQIPYHFMQNKWAHDIQNSINKIEHSLNVERNISEGYDELVQLVKSRAEGEVPNYKIKAEQSKKMTSRKRKNANYWNDDLEEMWKHVCQLEKQWRKCRDNTGQEKKGIFNRARKEFDRMLRQVRRNFQHDKQEKMLQACAYDVNSFWKEIDCINKGIAGDRRQRIPMEVLEDGEITSNIELVLNKWKHDFKMIYENVGHGQFNEEHLEYISQRIPEMERLYENILANQGIADGTQGHAPLNAPLTYNEIRPAIFRAKKRKAVGLDELPAELLQNETAVHILFRIFSHCFESASIPTVWQQGIINPIFKPSNTDIRDPLHYRGITLMCSSYKIYCDILNTRLNTWLEERDAVADEQNGFRALRSCIDHVYSLYSIIQNRLLLKQDTFCCYIDL
jgi:hypothetical protein